MTTFSKPRTYLTMAEKKNKVINVNELCDGGASIRAACSIVSIQPKQYRSWSAQLEAGLLDNPSPKALTIHKGRPSILGNVEEELVEWIFEKRETGMAISPRHIVLHACELVPELRQKTYENRIFIIRRFMKKYRFTIRAVTHECQVDPKEKAEEAEKWMESAVPRLVGSRRDKRFIINMDQTPVFFSMHESRTVEQVGVRTVTIRGSKDGSKRATVAVTVTASGEILCPMIIFKGKAGARVEGELKKGVDYPGGLLFAAQKNAWMDERCMTIWINQVLFPYVCKAPLGVRPVILLDAYRCHVMDEIVAKIENAGIEVMHLPPGCTSLTQPVDIGINKPLKTRVRAEWEDWMLRNNLIKRPHRRDIAKWVHAAFNDLPATVVRNSWRKSGYSYFPNEEKE